ncbi:MAG TPA: CSLREA domain-containing protein, partial [Thermoanaerobaculia bacterium]|nr:CSLREA domain-containing protein [Thermoanaerobaculia bacterium]
MGTSKLPCKKTLALLIGLAAASALPAAATVFTVTKTDDTLDGACDLDCSLREAVTAANGAAGSDVIILPEGRYILARPGADEDQAASGDLDLRSDIVLLGGGALTTTIDGGLIDRILDIPSGATVEIQDVTVRGGRVNGNGAGIRALGNLALRRVTVTANEATGTGFGAGLYFDGDNTLTVESSAFTLNTGAGGGGGLALGGTASFTNVTISGNRSL